MTEPSGFYKDQYFKNLENTLAEIKHSQELHAQRNETRFDDLDRKIGELDAKMRYVYGFAAGVGLVGSLAIDWIKNKLFT